MDHLGCVTVILSLLVVIALGCKNEMFCLSIQQMFMYVLHWIRPRNTLGLLFIHIHKLLIPMKAFRKM